MLARKATRRTRQSNTFSDASRNVTTRPNPLPVSLDLKAQQRSEVLVTWTSSGSSPPPPVAGTLSVKDLVDTLPGGSAVWTHVQFHRFDVYGAAPSQLADGPVAGYMQWPSVAVTLNEVNNTSFGDVPTFYDDAVTNSRRAHVGVVPNAVYRKAWNVSSSTDPLLTFNTYPYYNTGTPTVYNYEVLVQFVFVVRSVPNYNFTTAPVTVKSVHSRVVAAVDRENPGDEWDGHPRGTHLLV